MRIKPICPPRRAFPILGGIAISFGGLFLGPMDIAAQAQGVKQALSPYTETLPGSVVKVNMVPIPAGTVTIGGKPMAIKAFWMEDTEVPWEAFDVFLASGPPSKPYDQTKFAPDAIARPSHSY